MTDKELEEKTWKDRKIKNMWISEGFGKAILNINTTTETGIGYCYKIELKKLDIRLARLKQGAKK